MEAIKAFESGMVAFQGGQHAESEKSVRACIKANPNHARGCNAAAYFCIERRELKEAGVLLKKAVTTDPQMEAIHCNMGTVAFLQGDNQLAMATYEKALQINAKHFEALLFSAVVHLRAGDAADKAEGFLRRAMAVDPGDSVPVHLLANLLFSKVNVAEDVTHVMVESIALYEQAMQHWVARRANPLRKPKPKDQQLICSPQDSSALGAGEICCNHGLALRASRIRDETVHAASLGGDGGAGELVPEPSLALPLRQGEIDAFERGLGAEPHHACCHVNLGVSLLEVFLRNRLEEVDRLSEAHAHFTAAVEAGTGSGQPLKQALNGLALALMELGRAAEGVPLLRQAVAQDPLWRPATVNLGRCLAEAGETEEGLALLAKGVKKKRPDGSLAENLEYSAALLRHDPANEWPVAVRHMRVSMEADH